MTARFMASNLLVLPARQPPLALGRLRLLDHLS
jgi:hypothetical protein